MDSIATALTGLKEGKKKSHNNQENSKDPSAEAVCSRLLSLSPQMKGRGDEVRRLKMEAMLSWSLPGCRQEVGMK